MTKADQFKISIKLLIGKEIRVGETYYWKDSIYFTIIKFLRKGMLIRLHYMSASDNSQSYKEVKVYYYNAYKLFHGTNSR